FPHPGDRLVEDAVLALAHGTGLEDAGFPGPEQVVALALGDVEHGADKAQGVALAVLLQPTLDPDPALPAIGPADAHLQVHRPAARQCAALLGLLGCPVIGVLQRRMVENTAVL